MLRIRWSVGPRSAPLHDRTRLHKRTDQALVLRKWVKAAVTHCFVSNEVSRRTWGLVLEHAGKWLWQQHTESSRPTTHPYSERSQAQGGPFLASSSHTQAHLTSMCQDNLKIGRKDIIPTHYQEFAKSSPIYCLIVQLLKRRMGGGHSLGLSK